MPSTSFITRSVMTTSKSPFSIVLAPSGPEVADGAVVADAGQRLLHRLGMAAVVVDDQHANGGGGGRFFLFLGSQSPYR